MSVYDKDDLTQAEIDAYWRDHTPRYVGWIAAGVVLLNVGIVAWLVGAAWLRWLGL
jgi:hypothetical protein